MKELPYVVECKSFAKFFEPIAAFNIIGMADLYAKDCQKVNPHFTYRVVTMENVA